MQRLAKVRTAALVCLLMPIRLVAQGEASNGDLQAVVTHAMAGRPGTAVVLDVVNGRILASYKFDVAARRVVSPGSSIKPFTLMTLLESGKVTAQTSLMCRRPLTIAAHRLDCPHPDTHQPLDPATALAYSCNSYFTTVATRLTPSQLRDSFLKDGLASATGLAATEAVGSVSLPTTPDELKLEAIGEWGIKVTPLELLRAYRNLALQARSSPDDKLAVIFEGLQGSTSYGMGRLAQPDSTLQVAGKTGTARSEEGQWTHAWFAGYAPATKPEIVLVVLLEKGRGGGDAADVARQIFSVYARTHATPPPKATGTQQ